MANIAGSTGQDTSRLIRSEARSCSDLRCLISSETAKPRSVSSIMRQVPGSFVWRSLPVLGAQTSETVRCHCSWPIRRCTWPAPRPGERPCDVRGWDSGWAKDRGLGGRARSEIVSGVGHFGVARALGDPSRLVVGRTSATDAVTDNRNAMCPHIIYECADHSLGLRWLALSAPLRSALRHPADGMSTPRRSRPSGQVGPAFGQPGVHDRWDWPTALVPDTNHADLRK